MKFKYQDESNSVQKLSTLVKLEHLAVTPPAYLDPQLSLVGDLPLQSH